jgi:hypothetical protein
MASTTEYSSYYIVSCWRNWLDEIAERVGGEMVVCRVFEKAIGKYGTCRGILVTAAMGMA